MAGRKKAVPVEGPTTVRVWPTEVFNTDGRVPPDKDWQQAARDLRYEFAVSGGVLHRLWVVNDTTGTTTGCTPVAAFDVNMLKDGPIDVTYDPADKSLTAAAPAKKAWVVGRVSYTYNDEVYSRAEEDPVHPTRVFFSKDAADTYAHACDVSDALESDNPFQFLNVSDPYDGVVAADELVTMDVDAWRDWLMERGIDAPNTTPDGDFDRDELEAWWSDGVGHRSYSVGGYVEVKGKWSPEQRQAAAEHLAVLFYEVTEVDVG